MPQFDLLNSPRLDKELMKIILDSPMPGLDAQPSSECTSRELRLWLGRHSLAAPCAAGLWLLAGDLHQSHTLSQDIKSSDGSFWHGIMHRREGDFWNAKYWFQRTSGHPVHQQLASTIESSITPDSVDLPLQLLRQSATVASTLVDCCQQALSSRETWREPLTQIFWWEWQLLWDHCYDRQTDG